MNMVFSWKKVVFSLPAHHWRMRPSTTVCVQPQQLPQQQHPSLTVHRHMLLDQPLQRLAVLLPVLIVGHQYWQTRLLAVYICPLQCHQAPLAVMRHCRLGKYSPNALYTVSQLNWCQNLNPFKYDILYHFNYIYYHLFNVICNSFIKMYSLVSEIWKFKDHQFVNHVASTENHLAFVLMAVSQMIIRTIA